MVNIDTTDLPIGILPADLMILPGGEGVSAAEVTEHLKAYTEAFRSAVTGAHLPISTTASLLTHGGKFFDLLARDDNRDIRVFKAKVTGVDVLTRKRAKDKSQILGKKYLITTDSMRKDRETGEMKPETIETDWFEYRLFDPQNRGTWERTLSTSIAILAEAARVAGVECLFRRQTGSAETEKEKRIRCLLGIKPLGYVEVPEIASTGVALASGGANGVDVTDPDLMDQVANIVDPEAKVITDDVFDKMVSDNTADPNSPEAVAALIQPLIDIIIEQQNA